MRFGRAGRQEADRDMVPDETDELNEIGEALAGVVKGRRFSLTTRQRAVLVRASLGDMLDAIVRHLPTPDVSPWREGGDLRDSNELLPLGGLLSRDEDYAVGIIASAWATEWKAVLGNPETRDAIAEAFASHSPVDDLGNVIETDDRLTTTARETVYRVLPLPEYAEQQTPHAQSSPAYLSSIAATGFRGVGRRAKIPLNPGPGLTMVHGANGSGKSSFVEALDVLLTGNTGRFQQRGPEWAIGWTNIHAQDGGSVEATVVSWGQDAKALRLSRQWKRDAPPWTADNGELDASLRLLGWLNALETYRPILGYAELGPLFDEEVGESSSGWVRKESPLARHIRLRTGAVDALLMSLSTGSDRSRRLSRPPFKDELANWLALDAAIEHGLSFPGIIPQMSSISFTDTLRRSDDYSEVRSGTPRRLIPKASAPTTDHGNRDGGQRDAIAAQAQSLRRQLIDYFQYYPAPVGQVFADMMLDVAHEVSLREFSAEVKEIWGRIRPGSAANFEKITIRRAYDAQTSRPTSRVSFDFVIDGISSVERGVLSQGELHTLALSMFLPTMARPESPFGFAVVDDPVQVMDQYAVAGLTQVLEEYAKKLQLIVFTHDERLPLALRRADIDHTLIDIQRSDESVVKCEVLYDPVTQRLRDAREEARRPESDNWMGRRQDVADQCRRAIEAACTHAVVRRRTHEGQPAVDIFEEIDRLKEDSKSSMRGLLALAIWGEEGKIGEVSKFLTEQKSWGEEINEILNQVNKLVHAADADAAKAAYAGDDLDELIDKVELVIKAIEANCG